MNHPLNVLRVITWLPVGGIERKILAVLPRLDRSKFNVRLVCLRERGALADELESAGIPVDLCAFPKRLSPGAMRVLAGLMRRHKIDIVHSHMYRSNVPATIAARMARVPVMIAQVHNVETWESARQRWMDRFLCRWRTTIVGVSDRVRRDVIEELGVDPARTRVLYNGVDIARFSNGSLRAPARAALGFGPEDIVIIYHGRLVDQKNPEALLKIAYEVAARRQRVFVLVVGEGPCRQTLELGAAARGVDDRMRFLGQRDDIPALLNASDIAVLPSFKEGFSNSLIEAMAAGLPIVATDVGGNAEAVEHGKSGWIVRPRDDAALLNAVAHLVDDAVERSAMSACAAQRAEIFSLDRMVANVEAMYLELAGKAGLI